MELDTFSHVLGGHVQWLCMVEARSSSWPPSQWLTYKCNKPTSHYTSVKLILQYRHRILINLNLTDLGCVMWCGLITLVSHWLGGQDDDLASTKQSTIITQPRMQYRHLILVNLLGCVIIVLSYCSQTKSLALCSTDWVWETIPDNFSSRKQWHKWWIWNFVEGNIIIL